MSKKKEKQNQKALRELKKTAEWIYFMWIPFVVGIVLIVLGFLKITGDERDYREYRNAGVVTNVMAEATYVEVKSEKGDFGRKIYVYDAKLKFVVDGTEYTGKKRFYKKTQKGDMREVEVYQRPDGTYRIPRVTSRDQVFIGYIIGIITILSGSLAALIGLFSMIVSMKGRKKLREWKAKSAANSGMPQK